MKRGWRAGLAALLPGGAGVSTGHAADGLYLGAGLGLATVRGEIEGETLDSDDAAVRVFAGWRFDQVPVIDLAVEGAYTDFGSPSQAVGGRDVRFNLSGASLAGLLILPVGPLDFYGKAGLLSWRSESSDGSSTTDRSGSDPFYGAGFGFYLWKIGIRVEYERFDIKDVDRMEMVSLQALFQF
jgi:OmpA-like transmembrane domain